jgi:hypothetical protein
MDLIWIFASCYVLLVFSTEAGLSGVGGVQGTYSLFYALHHETYCSLKMERFWLSEINQNRG